MLFFNNLKVVIMFSSFSVCFFIGSVRNKCFCNTLVEILKTFWTSALLLSMEVRHSLGDPFPFGDMKHRNAAQQNRKARVVENGPVSLSLIHI